MAGLVDLEEGRLLASVLDKENSCSELLCVREEIVSPEHWG